MPYKLTGDGSLTLHSERYGQTFHSLHGAVAESRHVFLEASGIAGRLAAGEACRVLEVGFGTGLNFWLTADAAVQADAPLEYVALEQDLLPAAVVKGLGYAGSLSNPRLLQRYLEVRATLPGQVPAGRHAFEPAPGVMLHLLIGDACEQALPQSWAHAVYHDAFSPDANPELWTEEFLSALVRALVPGGVLVSYSVKGEIRRRLQALGLEVSKRPGPPGGKREMLVATAPAQPSPLR